MSLDSLPEAQRILWPRLSETPPEFVLYGGTAIALRLRHRESVDFDFFSTSPFSPEELPSAIPYLREAQVVQIAKNTLTCIVGFGSPVRVSFFGGLDIRSVQPPDRAADNGVQVASLMDLAGTKAAVVQARASAKDYLDMDALIEASIPLRDALGAAAAIYGRSNFNPLLTLKALSYYGEKDLQSLPRPVRDRLSLAVAGIDVGDIPYFRSRSVILRNEHHG